jgi:hypothetical protein
VSASINITARTPRGRSFSIGVRGIFSAQVRRMKIDKHDAEWKLSEGNETLGFVREFLGSFFVYRSGASHTEPQGPYRSMREAVNSLQRRARRKRGLVYYRGALTRRREED